MEYYITHMIRMRTKKYCLVDDMTVYCLPINNNDARYGYNITQCIVVFLVV